MLKPLTREAPPTMEERIREAKESMPKDSEQAGIWMKGFLIGADQSRQWMEEALAWRMEAIQGTLNYFLLVKLSSLGEDTIEQLNQQWEEFLAKLGPLETVSNEIIIDAAVSFAKQYQHIEITDSIM